MCEKTKPSEDEREEQEDTEEKSQSADQKKRSYYYDDAHGYEIYDPDDEETDEES